MCQGSVEDPDADSFEVTNVYYKNRGAGKQQVKGRQRSVIQGGVTRYRMAVRVRAGRMVKTGETSNQELEKDRSKRKNTGRLDDTKLTGYRQTENTK